jgi:hypothetical protein
LDKQTLQDFKVIVLIDSKLSDKDLDDLKREALD